MCELSEIAQEKVIRVATMFPGRRSPGSLGFGRNEGHDREFWKFGTPSSAGSLDPNPRQTLHTSTFDNCGSLGRQELPIESCRARISWPTWTGFDACFWRGQ